MTTTEQQTAQRVRSALDQQLAELRQRGDLSPAGRRRQMARAVVTAQGRLAQLRAEEDQRIGDRRAELEHSLFSNANRDPLSARDAADRAARVRTPAEADALLTRAQRDDDAVLARAVAASAAERVSATEPAWQQVLSSWAQQVPGAVDTLDELAEIDGQAHDTLTQMRRQSTYRALVPDELRGVGNLDALAAAADDDTEAVS